MKFQAVAHHDSDLNVKVIVIEGKSIYFFILFSSNSTSECTVNRFEDLNYTRNLPRHDRDLVSHLDLDYIEIKKYKRVLLFIKIVTFPCVPTKCTSGRVRLDLSRVSLQEPINSFFSAFFTYSDRRLLRLTGRPRDLEGRSFAGES